MGLADGNHVPDTGGQIVPLFDDGAPGRPDGRLSVLVEGEDIVKGLHVLLVERLIAVLFHVVRVGGPLGVDVEHDKAVKAVVEGHPLHRLQGVVQIVGGGSGGVDAHTDEGALAPGGQNVSVLAVEGGHVQPPIDVIVLFGGERLVQRLLEGQQFKQAGFAAGNVHGGSSLMFFPIIPRGRRNGKRPRLAFFLPVVYHTDIDFGEEGCLCQSSAITGWACAW